MAEKGKRASIRDRFVGLSTPAKAMVFMAIAGVAGLAIAAIVVSGPPKQDTGALGAGADQKSLASSSTTAAASTALSPWLPDTTSGPSASPGSASVGSTVATGSSGGMATGKKTTDSKPSGPSGNSGATEEDPETQAPSTPPALTPDLRERIAGALVAAEKRAETEAASKYPVDPKQGGTPANSAKYERLRSSLIDTYTAAILRQYGLTTEQTIDILIRDAATD